MQNRRKIVTMERLVRLKDQDRSFDLAFWKRVGASGRFEAAWQMVCDYVKWKKINGFKQRLRRSVESLKYRSS